MVRPKCPRQVNSMPGSTYFKPRGIPVTALEEVVLSDDEFEAIRLADYEGLYQEAAAERMNVSRPTFGRILESARRKTADALLNGKALRIEGGHETTLCPRCNQAINLPDSKNKMLCPYCKKTLREIKGEDS